MTTIYYKNNDEFKTTEINVWSGNRQKDEEIIWSFTEQKGFFQKHFSKVYSITNFRIFVYDFEIKKMTGLLLMANLGDIVVSDTYRSYNSVRYGAYGYGLSGGQSRGESVTIGKITFMSNGSPIISLNGVTDPNGLRKMVKSIKASLYPKKELQRWISGMRSDELPSRSMCTGCGNENQSGSSFCNKCGHVLR